MFDIFCLLLQMSFCLFGLYGDERLRRRERENRDWKKIGKSEEEKVVGV